MMVVKSQPGGLQSKPDVFKGPAGKPGRGWGSPRSSIGIPCLGEYTLWGSSFLLRQTTYPIGQLAAQWEVSEPESADTQLHRPRRPAAAREILFPDEDSRLRLRNPSQHPRICLVFSCPMAPVSSDQPGPSLLSRRSLTSRHYMLVAKARGGFKFVKSCHM